MIPSATTTITSTAMPAKKRLDDRITGYVPVWGQAGPASGQRSNAASAIVKNQVTEKISKTENASFAAILNDKSASAENPTVVVSPDKAAAPAASTAQPGEDSSFGFLDLVDMVNPLQHIPVVGTIYRHITGDEIKPISKVIGGGAFGGILGAASGLVDAMVQSVTGKDIGNHLSTDLSEYVGNEDSKDENVALTFASLHSRHYNS